MTIVGDGKQTRDFIWVIDLVDAAILAAKKGKNGEIYNLGSGKETSVNKIAKIIGGKKIFIPKGIKLIVEWYMINKPRTITLNQSIS